MSLTGRLYKQEAERLTSAVEADLRCYEQIPLYRFIKRHNTAHRVVRGLLAQREAEAQLAQAGTQWPGMTVTSWQMAARQQYLQKP